MLFFTRCCAIAEAVKSESDRYISFPRSLLIACLINSFKARRRLGK
ncbi:hypothetical protein [Nostoc sp.]